MKYQRVVLKLSGEALMGNDQYGINAERIAQYTSDISTAVEAGAEIAIVIGGGNIFRGLEAEETGIGRVEGDYMGMLATVINGMALQSAIERNGLQTRLMSAIQMEQVCEPYIRRRAIRHLEKGRVVIMAAGTGSPYFTTDTAASLRAIEIEADVILKGTKVDGVYSSDPHQNTEAKRFDKITFEEVYTNNLQVMDMTAFTLCKENQLPIIVFDITEENNLLHVIEGKEVGTLVSR